MRSKARASRARAWRRVRCMISMRPESVPEKRTVRALRVLLAEDNPINQRLTLRLLEKRGHTVVAAADGVEALEALDREAFDLVLMDVQMPRMDGFQVTAIVRRARDN